MVVLITGATGFVGSRLSARLHSSGYNVIASGRGSPSIYKGSHKYIQLEMNSVDQCLKVLKGVDAVVHCAGKAGTWGPHSSYVSANVLGTKNLLQACKEKSVKRFVNISSPSIYFDYKDQFMLKEGDLPQIFSNSYAVTKFEAEKLVASAHSEKLATISLRPRGVIGAGDNNWLPRIIELRKKNSLIQPGDGKNMVDFTSIENLLDAIELCLTTDKINCGRAYNITNGEPIKLWDFIEKSVVNNGL